MKLTQYQIAELVENQLGVWPLAKRNYDALSGCRRRPFVIGELKGAWQYNQARIVSTAADLKAVESGERPCFLCKKNRPKEQLSIPFANDWEILVNPYPIFPIHLTIASMRHIPQDSIPLEAVSLAEKLVDMVVFFNGAKGGASAPDHLHLQAVLKEELPLIRLIEERHLAKSSEIQTAGQLGLDLPFNVVSAVVYPDADGMRILSSIGDDNDGLMNFYSFIDKRGILRLLWVPRSAHRPDCYYADGTERLTVSPGAIDMAGIIITPVEADFEKITEEATRKIYAQTGKPIGRR